MYDQGGTTWVSTIMVQDAGMKKSAETRVNEQTYITLSHISSFIPSNDEQTKNDLGHLLPLKASLIISSSALVQHKA